MTRVMITDPFYADIHGAGPWYAARSIYSKYGWTVEIADDDGPLLILLLDREVRVIPNHLGTYNPHHWAEAYDGRDACCYDTKPGYGRHKYNNEEAATCSE